MIRPITILCLWLTLWNVFAAGPLICETCGKRITGRYLKTGDGHVYCSRQCAEAQLPKCAYCGKPCLSRIVSTDKRIFCSPECADAALLPACDLCGKPFREGRQIATPYGEVKFCMGCAARPACFVCEIPGGDHRRLPDGRYLCRRCAADAVSDPAEAEKLLGEVRELLCRKLNFKTDYPIVLRLVADDKSEDTPLGTSREFGLYMYNGREIYTTPSRLEFWKEQKTSVQRETQSCQIVLLDHLPRVKMAEVMAHELAHDYMQRRWPYIADQKIKEGFAETVAAEYNRLTGQSVWNYRMEKNPDPVYGDGYRVIREWQKRGGWPEVARQLETENRKNLPPELRQP